MNRTFIVALLLGSLSIACGKPYIVMRETVPNPFTRANCKISIEPVHTDHLVVGNKSVQEYMASKTDAKEDKFQGDLAESSARFVEMVKESEPGIFLPGGTPDNTFIMRPMMTHWEPGFYAYVASHPSSMEIVVDVFDSNGTALDEILVRGTAGASVLGTGMNMRYLGERLGRSVGHYLHDRWACATY